VSSGTLEIGRCRKSGQAVLVGIFVSVRVYCHYFFESHVRLDDLPENLALSHKSYVGFAVDSSDKRVHRALSPDRDFHCASTARPKHPFRR
jgi:hypothetical protein